MVDAMITEVADELVGLSDDQLVERIEANELERRRLDAEMSTALAVAKARNLHAVEGHRTMTAFCRARLNWSTTEAGRRLSLARAVNDMCGLGEAWGDGRFGLPQAVKLSMVNANPRVAEQLPAFAAQLLEHAEQMPYSDFVAVVDHFVARADEDGSHEDRDEAVEGRRARVTDVGGMLDVRASGGDGLLTAELVEIHARFTEIEYRSDLEARRREHGELADGFALRRTDRQRRFDALIAIFRAAANAGDIGTAAEPLVNVTVDAATWGRMLLAAGLTTATDLDGRPIDPFTGLAVEETDQLLTELADAATRACESTNGVPLHTHDVLRAALAGHVRRVVVDSDQVVIDLGRRQRLFTGSARQAAKLLIHRCEHVGCELPADWCEIDHVEEWDRDIGGTDQRNAAVLCRAHNNDKHQRKWRTKRALNRCSYTIDQHGVVIMPVGTRPPRFADDDDSFDDEDPEHEDPEQVARMTAFIRNRLREPVRTMRSIDSHLLRPVSSA